MNRNVFRHELYETSNQAFKNLITFDQNTNYKNTTFSSEFRTAKKVW